MKVEVRRRNSKASIVMEVESLGVKPPPGDEYIIEATVDEGDSPLMLIARGASLDGFPKAVQQLRLTRSAKYHVKKFRRNGSKAHTVSDHDRKKPGTTKNYAKWKENISKALKAKWATLTPEERSAEAKRRIKLGKQRKAEKAEKG